jgi:hypothetical protein
VIKVQVEEFNKKRLIMKITKSIRMTVMLGMTVFTGTALAYGDTDKDCKDPKFRTFEPEHLSEVDPETEISFHVSNWADPITIKVEARKVPMEVSVVDKMNFFVATAKLPASINGKYARIHVSAKAKDGRCLGQDGWLLKVKKAKVVAEPVASEAEEVEKAPDEKVEN